MKDVTKDWDYYAANPDQMPTDITAIEALMAGMEGGTQEPEQAEDDAAAGVETEGEGAVEEVETEAPQPAVETEAPVASKDGKHTIPYDVLRTEREKRRAAEAAILDLQQRVETLQQTGKVQETAESDTSDDDLAQMAEDFPAIAKLLEHTHKLEKQLQSVADRLAKEDQQRAEVSMVEVRAAVDANPTLLRWEQSDPDRWAAAIEADNKLQVSPAHRGLTLAERLEKAVGIVDAFYGPDAKAPVAAAKPVAKPAQAAPAARTTARTLSDIPGGVAAVTDPAEEFAQMSTERLGAQMANMTEAQVSALLARLG